MSDQYYRKFRQETPSNQFKWISEYNIEGSELNELQQSNPDVIYTQVLDLTTAQAQTNPIEVVVPGRGAVIYGYSSTSEYDPVNNTGVEVNEPAAFVMCRVNANRPENAMHMKHNRGFRGTFRKLFLSWPAQANIKAVLVVFKADAQPWISGESDNRFGRVEASNVDNGTVTSVGTTATLIAPAKIARKCASIYNNAATTVYVGGSGVTAATGLPLKQDAVLFYRNSAALYAITAAGTNADIRTLEEV